MDLRQLEAFAAVMTTGSITGAGQMMGRSQPAVTRSIQDLEQELGLRLFERSGPKVTPTTQAFLLRAEVESTLAGARQILQRAHHIAHDDCREISLGATPALAAGLIPAALARLPKELLPSQIHLRSMLAEQVVQAALAKTLDIGVVSLPLEHKGLQIHWIGEASCVAVMAENSPLALHQVVTLEQLAQQQVITLSNPYRLRGRIDSAFAGAGEGIKQLQETNSSLNAVQMARAGLGIALVDPVTALGIPMQGVVVRPLSQHIAFFFGLVSPFAYEQNEISRALINALKDTAQEILPNFLLHPPSQHDSLLQRLYR